MIETELWNNSHLEFDDMAKTFILSARNSFSVDCRMLEANVLVSKVYFESECWTHGVDSLEYVDWYVIIEECM